MEKNNEEKQLDLIQKGNNELLNELKSIIITNQEEYENAATFVKKVKDSNKKVKEYWKPLKDQAAKTHKELVSKEKDMLTPLEEAEKILKQKMTEYVEIQEEKARQEALELKKKQEELAMQQLEEAEKLRNDGDEISAAMAEQNALVIDSLNTNISSSVQKVDGVSYRTDYDVEIIDDKKVPSYIGGIEIRQINVQAIKKLAKATKGKIEIDGIKIIEKKVSSIRI